MRKMEQKEEKKKRGRGVTVDDIFSFFLL